jgi:hypothetical protein
MSTPNHPNRPRRRPSPGSSSMRNAQLPAFCRTRSSRTQLVSVNNLRNLQRLLLLVLLFQLSTLLLVVAGPVPQWPQVSTSTVVPRDAGTAGGGAAPVTPLAER